MIVTVSLRYGCAVNWPLDRKLTLWLGSLAALAAFNAGLWVWIARSGAPGTPYAEAQLLLSGVYVGVCGFRSLFPRVDLERVCLWDTWLSAIHFGRIAGFLFYGVGAGLTMAVDVRMYVQRWRNYAGGYLTSRRDCATAGSAGIRRWRGRCGARRYRG